MTWKLSRFRSGDLVEVRSKEEILATLDEHGCVEQLPFMPEMLRFCGQRIRISSVAHKTCDTARQTWKARRLDTTVHSAGVRCDGSAHGGCQAECNIFWKDAWLKPIEGKNGHSVKAAVDPLHARKRCTEEQLFANIHQNSSPQKEEPRYSCQATQMYEATQPLAWWDMRQYFFDVITRNHSIAKVLSVLFLASLRHLLPKLPIGYRLYKSFLETMYRRLGGRSSPSLYGKIPDGSPTPIGRLDLKPGEFVQIKPQVEIEQTLRKNGQNRGLGFDPEEMAPYCEGIFKVHKSVTKIIDEPTGRMLQMKQPCIMLEGVVCKGEYASGRLNCPRAIFAYWREIWLNRVDTSAGADLDNR